MKLKYAIKFVGDMDAAVAFHRDVLGLPLRFQSPGWSEFETGGTTLALHAASTANPAGSVQLGFASPDLQGLYDQRAANGLVFTEAPRDLHGSKVAQIEDRDGASYSLGEA